MKLWQMNKTRFLGTFLVFLTVLLSFITVAQAKKKYTEKDIQRYMELATANHLRTNKKVVAARKAAQQAIANLKRADSLLKYVNKAQTPQQFDKGSSLVRGLMVQLKMQASKEYTELKTAHVQQTVLLKSQQKVKSDYINSIQKMNKARQKFAGLNSLMRSLLIRQHSLSKKYATLSGGQKMTLKQNNTGNIFMNPKAKQNKAKLDAIKRQSTLIRKQQLATKTAASKARSDYEKAKAAAAQNARFWKRIKRAASSLARKAKAAAAAAKRKAAEIARKAKEAAKRAAAAAKRAFQRLLAKAKAWAIKYAKKTVNTFKNKAVSKITTAAASKAWEAYKMTKIKFKGNLMAHLKVGSDYKTIRDKMLSTQRGAKASKVYAKTALISVGLYLTFYALNTTVGCWTYAGAAKKACLSDYIATSMRDAVFDITTVLVTIALDVFVIDPLSHSFAAVVSAALAAGTFGIGVAAYPIAYFAASLAMNAMVLAIQELVLRKYYNKWYNGKPLAETKKLTTSMVKGMSNKVMVCFGPKSVCKKCYKGTCTN
jgi:hypothetical protein